MSQTSEELRGALATALRPQADSSYSNGQPIGGAWLIRAGMDREEFVQIYPYHLPDGSLPVGTDGYISYEEYFDWADEDTHAEWVDGVIEMSSPQNLKHERIGGFLYRLLKDFAQIYDLGEVLYFFQMKLPDKQGSGREPDLLFVAKSDLARLENGLVRGAANLAVEIVSPESRERDRQTKFSEYGQGGVLEYWLIDPDERQAEFYQLDEQSHYQPVAPNEAGKYYSVALPGFWLKPAWLWRTPLPSAERVLQAVAGADYVAYLARQLDSDEAL